MVAGFRGRVAVAGDDRLAEVASSEVASLFVNIQGDEPLIDPEAIDAAILSVLGDDSVSMGTLKKTIIDPTTHQVLGTRPVGFKVKWLADHMQSFDGTLLWTYGLRTERVGGTDVTKVDVIAFDPVALRVVKRQEVGRGPAHSVVLTPDRKQVLMNVASAASPGASSTRRPSGRSRLITWTSTWCRPATRASRLRTTMSTSTSSPTARMAHARCEDDALLRET